MVRPRQPPGRYGKYCNRDQDRKGEPARCFALDQRKASQVAQGYASHGSCKPVKHAVILAPTLRQGDSRVKSHDSAAQLLLDQPVYLAAVCAALGLLHHGTDDGADRLAVAGADLLGSLWVGLDRGGDYRLQLAAIGDLGEALALDDRGGGTTPGDKKIGSAARR